jgi:hypothetical protein
VANQLDIGIETLRYWVKHAEIDSGSAITWQWDLQSVACRFSQP